MTLMLSPLNSYRSTVLYTLGIVVSLIGTGFLIGVCFHHTHKLVSLTNRNSVFLSAQAGTPFTSLDIALHVHLPPQMFAPVRIVATIILFVSMGLVFVGAFVLGNAVRILVLSDVLGLTLFLAAMYRYDLVLLVGLQRILIYPTVVFVVIEYLAYTW